MKTRYRIARNKSIKALAMVFFIINNWHFKVSRYKVQVRALEPTLKKKEKLLYKLMDSVLLCTD